MGQREHRIYNPKWECIDREELRKWQGERLKETVRREYDNVPMYRARMDAAGVKPEDIRTVDDILWVIPSGTTVIFR